MYTLNFDLLTLCPERDKPLKMEGKVSPQESQSNLEKCHFDLKVILLRILLAGRC